MPKSQQAAIPGKAAAPVVPASAGDARQLARDATQYWIDAWQRSILFWDVMRKRGNIYAEHAKEGKPAVLAFDYETVVDGRQLPRPVNYALVRILPPQGFPVDPAKRPFVVIDPRAGHGPGIGGSKPDSEIGIAVRAGHPTYFITFYPDPESGQTIADIVAAEAVFLERVHELHPDASSKPFLVGNCQGGWALMLLASVVPERVGPILIAGSPISYWAGVEGKNPMRYGGGLLGGSWLTSLAGDLGHGKFDGAALVQNFEKMNPANTLWSKQYNLYANIDTEEARFLDFERWWGGFFLMNKEEMEWIVQNLFVGNKLTSGEIVLKNVGAKNDDVRVDLRNIRSPIIVFASWGDNITPPQQALNWIPDLYQDTSEIRAYEQTIVYCLHASVGHLGIFVSGKVAQREHAELVSMLDLVDMLPPGLYEAIIEDAHDKMERSELIDGRYLIRFEPREVDDILKFDDGRNDELSFEGVRRVSEINQRAYDMFLAPVIKAMSTEASAKMLRELSPVRMQRYMFSDLNPMMAPIRMLADMVRAQRMPADENNAFRKLEGQMSKQIEASLDSFRDERDERSERTFKAIYESPWLRALVGVPAKAPRTRAVRMSDAARAALDEHTVRDLQQRMDQGGGLEAWARIVAYAARESMSIDERPFKMLRAMGKLLPPDRQPTAAQLKAAFRDQTFMLMLDEDRAIATLPKLLPNVNDRARVLHMARVIAEAKGKMSPGLAQRFAQLEQVLGVKSTPALLPAPRAKPAITKVKASGRRKAVPAGAKRHR